MIAGAVVAGGAILLHHLFKWAKRALNDYRKQHSSFFSKANIEAAWTVFSQIAEIAYVTVIALRDGKLEHVDDKKVEVDDLPREAKKHLQKLKKQRHPRRMFGLRPSNNPEDFDHYAVQM